MREFIQDEHILIFDNHNATANPRKEKFILYVLFVSIINWLVTRNYVNEK